MKSYPQGIPPLKCFIVTVWAYKRGVKIKIKIKVKIKVMSIYLENQFNCYCPKCKKYQAERIVFGKLGYLGINCKCGNKKKANLNKIDVNTKSLFKSFLPTL